MNQRGDGRRPSLGSLVGRHRLPLALLAVAVVAVPLLLAASAGAARTPTTSPRPTEAVAGVTGTPPPASAGTSPRAAGSPSVAARGSASARPTPQRSAPSSAGPVSKFGYAAKGMRGEVLGFLEASHLGFALSALDYSVVSTLAFFSLTPTSAGTLDRSGSNWQTWISPAMDAVIARAHAAGTRVVMTLQGFAWDGADTAVSRAILSSPARRERLAEETAAEVVRRGVDGVDVDFEPIPPGLAHQFTDFVRRLRVRLDRTNRNYQLTVAVIGHFDSYDIAALTRPGGADAIYLMGYEFNGGWSATAGSTAPFGGGGYDVETAIAGLLHLLRPDQLIVGVPYYGHLWPTVSGAAFARTTGQGTDVRYPQAMTIARAHGLRHVAVQQTAWSAFQSRDCPTCAPHWTQLYFDDATSLATKWSYVLRHHLLGTGVWTIAYDDAAGSLDAAMRAVFLGAAAP